MRKNTSINGFARLMGMLATMGVSPAEAVAGGIEIPKQRKFSFKSGDQFYNHLRYKRINGKWRVKR